MSSNNKSHTGTVRKNGTAKTKNTVSSAKAKTKKSASVKHIKETPSAKVSASDTLLRKEAWIIITFLVSVLMFLSNFNIIGKAGEVISGVQFGLFGILAYVFPVFLLLTVLFCISNKGNSKLGFKVAALIVAVISFGGILHLFTGQLVLSFSEAGELYTDKAGGGFLGGLFASLLAKVTGSLGAFLIMLVLFILCAVYITERSFVGLVKKGGRGVYARARSDAQKLRQRRVERADERTDSSEVRNDRSAHKLSFPEVSFPSADTASPAAPFDRKEAYDDNVIRTPEAAMIRKDADAVSNTDNYMDDEILFETEKQLAASVARMQKKSEDSFRTPEDNIEKRYCSMKSSREVFEKEDTDESPLSEDVKKAIDRANDILSESIQETGYEGAYDINDLYDAASCEDPLYLERSSDEASTVIKPSRNTDPDNAVYDDPSQRRVVTSSGKIIPSDMDIVRERMAEKRRDSETYTVRKVVEENRRGDKAYRIPPVDLLTRGTGPERVADSQYKATASKLQETLKNFGIAVTVTDISVGPTVTRYELHPELGVKVSMILALSNDIQLALAAPSLRIEAPIPGKAAIGIEVPNKEKSTVKLRDIIESRSYKESNAAIAFPVGKDIAGKDIVADLAKMPHILIAGATGSGKSVCINTLIMGILYKYGPKEVNLIMIDPKMVELPVYNGIPHLLYPVVTDVKKATGALNWAVAEMEDRYRRFEEIGAKDIISYNHHMENARASLLREGKTSELPEKLPYIVIIIDELADMMMQCKAEVEPAIVRISQLARAAGMHLVIATQRPSVNVITGLIKANIPSRLALAVSSGVDSKTIIDQVGAEKLLGHGDMLFFPQSLPKPLRAQGAYVDEEEIQRVTDYIRKQELPSCGDEGSMDRALKQSQEPEETPDARDELFGQAGRYIIDKDKASIGNLQRAFRIGFNRAARIMDQLTMAGVVGPEQGTKPREVLMSMEEFENLI